jgi:hypothetical protein
MIEKNYLNPFILLIIGTIIILPYYLNLFINKLRITPERKTETVVELINIKEDSEAEEFNEDEMITSGTGMY